MCRQRAPVGGRDGLVAAAAGTDGATAGDGAAPLCSAAAAHAGSAEAGECHYTLLIQYCILLLNFSIDNSFEVL